MSSLLATFSSFQEGEGYTSDEDHATVELDLTADSDPIRSPIPISPVH